jgi:multimeric flavodoxin WrbA
MLSIIASPRKDGNTAALNQSFMEGFKSNCTKEIYYTIIHPYYLNIRPCIDCKGCYKEGKCLLNDDMKNIYPLLEESDLIVVSTPIYFNTVTAPLKALIDRCQAYWAGKYIVGNKDRREKVKVGIVLTTAGDIDGTDQYTIPM